MCSAAATTTATRHSGYQRIAAVIIIICALCADCESTNVRGQVATPPKKCAEFNEYCINHWDCCSNSCLSYVYRCTRNYGLFPYTFFGDTYPKKTTTLNNILEMNFGPQMPVQQYPQQNGVVRFKRQNSEDEVPPNVEATTADNENHRFMRNNNIIAGQCKGIFEHCDNHKECCSGRCDGFVHYCTSKPATTTITTGTGMHSRSRNGQCKQIFEKCDSNEACCSGHCHAAIHYCVTIHS